jgi:hypothetical protein
MIRSSSQKENALQHPPSAASILTPSRLISVHLAKALGLRGDRQIRRLVHDRPWGEAHDGKGRSALLAYLVTG